MINKATRYSSDIGMLCSSHYFTTFGWMVRISEIQRFWTFWKFSRGISIPFATVSKFSEVLVKWKALLIKPFSPESPVTACMCRSTSLLLLVMSSVLMVRDDFVRKLVQSEEIFQSIPEWAQFSQGHHQTTLLLIIGLFSINLQLAVLWKTDNRFVIDILLK